MGQENNVDQLSFASVSDDVFTSEGSDFQTDFSDISDIEINDASLSFDQWRNTTLELGTITPPFTSSFSDFDTSTPLLAQSYQAQPFQLDPGDGSAPVSPGVFDIPQPGTTIKPQEAEEQKGIRLPQTSSAAFTAAGTFWLSTGGPVQADLGVGEVGAGLLAVFGLGLLAKEGVDYIFSPQDVRPQDEGQPTGVDSENTNHIPFSAGGEVSSPTPPPQGEPPEDDDDDYDVKFNPEGKNILQQSPALKWFLVEEAMRYGATEFVGHWTEKAMENFGITGEELQTILSTAEEYAKNPELAETLTDEDKQQIETLKSRYDRTKLPEPIMKVELPKGGELDIVPVGNFGAIVGPVTVTDWKFSAGVNRNLISGLNYYGRPIAGVGSGHGVRSDDDPNTGPQPRIGGYFVNLGNSKDGWNLPAALIPLSKTSDTQGNTYINGAVMLAPTDMKSIRTANYKPLDVPGQDAVNPNWRTGVVASPRVGIEFNLKYDKSGELTGISLGGKVSALAYPTAGGSISNKPPAQNDVNAQIGQRYGFFASGGSGLGLAFRWEQNPLNIDTRNLGDTEKAQMINEYIKVAGGSDAIVDKGVTEYKNSGNIRNHGDPVLAQINDTLATLEKELDIDFSSEYEFKSASYSGISKLVNQAISQGVDPRIFSGKGGLSFDNEKIAEINQSQYGQASMYVNTELAAKAPYHVDALAENTHVREDGSLVVEQVNQNLIISSDGKISSEAISLSDQFGRGLAETVNALGGSTLQFGAYWLGQGLSRLAVDQDSAKDGVADHLWQLISELALQGAENVPEELSKPILFGDYTE